MERTAMSERDLARVSVLSRMVSGDLTSLEGAELLDVSVRQVKRLKKRYVAGGAIAAHKARHPAANHPWRGNDYLQHKRDFEQRKAGLIPAGVP
jgi:hypothetical protein